MGLIEVLRRLVRLDDPGTAHRHERSTSTITRADDQIAAMRCGNDRARRVIEDARRADAAIRSR